MDYYFCLFRGIFNNVFNYLIMRKYFLFVLFLSSSYITTLACTNFLVTKGATVDGSTMITYAADSHTLYGELYFTPAADYEKDAMLDIYEWDTGKFLGKIKQVPHTYSVVGNINEHQVAIGETTFGGREELWHQTKALVDYGSLMYITLQRAKTAREAIEIMTEIVEEYGYYSEGESFSISDPNEVWIMEMIGKGEFELGAVWVALKVPDGYVCGHANQARITTFPLNDPDNCLYSKDIFSFARERGWFDGLNKDFSFSDVFAPTDFGAARYCDSRVWMGFSRISSGLESYVDYVSGKVKYDDKGFAINKIPLWVKPDSLLKVSDVMRMMRDHFEGTPLDMTEDIGAGPYKLPYRSRPLDWKVDSVMYCNERAVSTQQTGFSFIAQSRSYLPDPIGGIIWFGVDDTYSTCYVPMYCGINQVPSSFAVGNGDMLTYSETSAFWTFNLVSNLTYLRYDSMIKDVVKVQEQQERKFFKMVPAIDAAAVSLINNGDKQSAIDLVTEFSVNAGDNTVKIWKELWQYLLIKYKDGNIMKEKDGAFERTETGVAAYPDQPGYPDDWYRAIINQTGDKLKVISKEK